MGNTHGRRCEHLGSWRLDLRGSQASSCLQENYSPDSATLPHQTTIDSPECRQLIGRSEMELRRDAAAAQLGFFLVAASTVMLSKARRQTKRGLMALEFGMLVLVAAYTVYGDRGNTLSRPDRGSLQRTDFAVASASSVK